MLNKKFISLCLLVVQTVLSVSVIRLSRKVPSSNGVLYLSSSVVFMSELFKLIGSMILSYMFESKTLSFYSKTNNWYNPVLLLKYALPAIMYTIQNNLCIFALSNLTPPVYQILYQLKILATAALSTFVLLNPLKKPQALSLIILTFGVMLCLPIKENHNTAHNNTFLGSIAVIVACITSAFSGLYIEYLLKNSSEPLWCSNCQLAVFSLILSVLNLYINHYEVIWNHGVFQGFNFLTWLVCIIQGVGGLIIAYVIKHANNVLKCFANAVAIVCSCLLTHCISSDFKLSFQFLIGASFVIISVLMYNDLLYLNFKLKQKLKTVHINLE